jgi:glutamate dehydrogenase/leucine dehydrogenase
MEGALAFAGMGDLTGKTVAIQGLGNVGGAAVGFLLDKGVARVIGSDVDPVRVAAAAALGDRVDARLVPPNADAETNNAILSEVCDIVSPCGFGGILNETTVPTIQAKIVCGAANNQLQDPVNDYGMQKMGILYVPDFVANRMGIVNCANEQYGRVGSLSDMEDPSISRHFDPSWENSLFNIVHTVLGDAAKNNITTVEAANTLSDALSREEHPIWGGDRSRAIIKSVLADGWSN